MYVVDSSALWRIQRDPSVRERWRAAVEAGDVRSCSPQRVEMCRSARSLVEFEQMASDLGTFYPDVPVPKGVWRWIDAAQHTLARADVL